MSLVVSCCAAFFPRDVLNEIWDGIESVSEGFSTYSSILKITNGHNSANIACEVTVLVMSLTSEKLRGHIGLGPSVCPSVRLSVRSTWQLRNSRTAYARILKLYMWHVHEQ